MSSEGTVLRVALIGPSGSGGKTTFVNRLDGAGFVEGLLPTRGASFVMHSMVVDGIKYNLRIYGMYNTSLYLLINNKAFHLLLFTFFHFFLMNSCRRFWFRRIHG